MTAKIQAKTQRLCTCGHPVGQHVEGTKACQAMITATVNLGMIKKGDRLPCWCCYYQAVMLETDKWQTV
jgi:hypothetical protein